MPMLIDQAGLPAGAPGRARKGLNTGATVILTDTTPGGTTVFELLWVPVADVSAIESLAASAEDSHVWTFTPTAGVTGAYRIQVTHTADNGVQTMQTLIFGIPDDDGNVPPAPGERADPNATLRNATNPDIIARCERNWPTSGFPAGNPFGWGVDLKLGGGSPAGARELVVASEPITASDHAISAGYLYVVFAQANDVTVALVQAPAMAGKRFAIKVSGETEASAMPLHVQVPEGHTIEADDGDAEESVKLLQRAGTYREWLCDESGNHWVLVGTSDAVVVGGGSGNEGSAVEGSRILIGPEHTLVAGCRYIIFGTGSPDKTTSITLPDASLPKNTGRSITVSVSGDRFVRVMAPPGNYLVDERSNLTDQSLEPLLRGTYTFSAMYDGETYPVGIWLMQRYAGTLTRSSIDVDYVMPQPLPRGFAYESLGQLHRLVANPESTEPLPIDGALQQNYPVGTTLLVPFDMTAGAGLYIVERDNGPSDWSLRCLARCDTSPDGDDLRVAADSMSEYIIRQGTQWKGRRFLQSNWGWLTAYELLPGSMTAYPYQVDLAGFDPEPSIQPQGASQYFQNGCQPGQLLLGRVNKLDISVASEVYAYAITWPRNTDAFRLNGERFAIAQSRGSGQHVEISSADNSIRMQHPSGDANSHVVQVLIEPGTYCEWQLDAPARLWRVVNHTPPSSEQLNIIGQNVQTLTQRALAFASSGVYTSITIWPGVVWRVVNSFNVTLDFSGSNMLSARFGIKTANVESPRAITIAASNPGTLLEADDGSFASTIVISQASRGFYREWMCDEDGNWRLLIST